MSANANNHEHAEPRDDGPRDAHVPLWQKFERIMRRVSPEAVAELPADGAEEHDHYIYGTPKKNGS